MRGLGSLTRWVVGILGILLAFSSSAFASGEYEPNDSYIAAYGPISAGVSYSGTLETSNDVDYFYFYLPQQTQLQFRTTDTSTKDVYICSRIEHQYSDYVDTVGDSSLSYINDGESASGAVTLEPGKYYYIIDCPGAIGEKYTFSIGPPGVTSTYEPFARACAAAHPAVESAASNLKKARARLIHVKNSLAANRRYWSQRHVRHALGTIARLRRDVAAQTAAFNKAADEEQAACSVPQ